MDFLVAEETVGYGPCLEVDSTSARHLNLVPLMHQIRPDDPVFSLGPNPPAVPVATSAGRRGPMS